jgi:hypothetical protein
MNDINQYRILISGSLSKEDIEPFSPPELSFTFAVQDTTSISFHTDQSGLIGFLRHLHGLGLIILSVTCERADAIKE